jgi:uncharacterized repeat protein (TIGR01451 family)
VASCVDLPQETHAMRVLVDEDYGTHLRAVVHALNRSGAVDSATALSDQVRGTLPAGGTVTFTGAALVGDTLRLTAGGWTGRPTPTVTYRWERCRAGTCTTIDGAADTAYAIAPSEVGATLRAVARATNQEGAAEVTSSPSAVVALPAPRLRIAVVASTARPALGDTVTFTVTVRNEGTAAARTTVLPLPDEPRFVRVAGTASQGMVHLVDGHWTVGTLAIDGEAVLTLRVVVRKGSDPQGAR